MAQNSRPNLSRPFECLYLGAMIAVRAENDRVEVTIPTADMTADEINDFVAWLRVESIARRSKLTSDAAGQLSEEIKTEWWRRNESRLSAPDTR